jgi:hypothetical protein
MISSIETNFTDVREGLSLKFDFGDFHHICGFENVSGFIPTTETEMHSCEAMLDCRFE